MRVLLVTAGSHGDINPFIAIGCALVERGHAAALLANPYYERQVREAGIAFEPCGEFMDLRRVGEEYPDLMHPTRGTSVVVDAMIVPTSREAFRRVHEIAARDGLDAIVAHPVVPGAIWAAEHLGIPCAHASLAPLYWMSRHEPLVGNGWMPPEPFWFMRRLLRAVMIPVMERYFQPHLARLRRELGLPPRAHLLLEAMRGGAVNLGLWSPHLRGALPDDPPGGRICGYAWHDRHGDVEAPPDDVRRFLEEGEPPILFCLGTAAVHVAGDFYDHAAAACARIGRRGLLLMGPGRVPARRWPAGVRAFEYAPFSSVMPRCAVNVHHGGIGSTGQALRAGRPTVVIPHAHDQWDNAARVLRLGVSRTLPRSRVTARSLARVLAGVAESAPMADTARDLARRMEGEDGARAAAAHVETLAAVPGGAGDAG